MDLLKDDVEKLYQKFLFSSIGAALAMSIYSLVDTIAVGQAEGPIGAAAMAVISPFYGLTVFLAILCGIGGAVLMGKAKGEGYQEKGNAYFTAALLLVGILIAVAWMAFIFGHGRIFTFFGADTVLMPKVMEYARWLIYTFPIFVLTPFLGAFIRNDGAPGLAMAAVVIGGGVNIFGDWFFVFPLGMGMMGAAIATVLGTMVQVVVLSSHFWRKNCRLRLVKPYHVRRSLRKILSIGFGTSVLDLGTVVLVILMNNQIMRYGSAGDLAVYGVVGTIAALFQAMFGGVGQAIQPIVSANYGAGQMERIKNIWRYALATVLVMGLAFTAVGELWPEQIIRLFIDVTPEVLVIAPKIMRTYFLWFLFLGVSVLATYYLQSVMQGKMSMMVASLRSIVLSGLLLVVLPLKMGILGVWLAMPVSEMLVAALALYYIRKKL